jgi:hypothetical protein
MMLFVLVPYPVTPGKTIHGPPQGDDFFSAFLEMKRAGQAQLSSANEPSTAKSILFISVDGTRRQGRHGWPGPAQVGTKVLHEVQSLL